MRQVVSRTGEFHTEAEAIAGCSIQADPGAVHREEGAPSRAVVALACDPATRTMPIDKSPAERSA